MYGVFRLYFFLLAVYKIDLVLVPVWPVVVLFCHYKVNKCIPCVFRPYVLTRDKLIRQRNVMFHVLLLTFVKLHTAVCLLVIVYISFNIIKGSTVGLLHIIGLAKYPTYMYMYVFRKNLQYFFYTN